MTFSVQQIAERFGVSTHTVLKWISLGDLKAIKAGQEETPLANHAGGTRRIRIVADTKPAAPTDATPETVARRHSILQVNDAQSLETIDGRPRRSAPRPRKEQKA
jgi:excisionase family DNA binding protein